LGGQCGAQGESSDPVALNVGARHVEVVVEQEPGAFEEAIRTEIRALRLAEPTGEIRAPLRDITAGRPIRTHFSSGGD